MLRSAPFTHLLIGLSGSQHVDYHFDMDELRPYRDTHMVVDLLYGLSSEIKLKWPLVKTLEQRFIVPRAALIKLIQ